MPHGRPCRGNIREKQLFRRPGQAVARACGRASTQTDAPRRPGGSYRATWLSRPGCCSDCRVRDASVASARDGRCLDPAEAGCRLGSGVGDCHPGSAVADCPGVGGCCPADGDSAREDAFPDSAKADGLTAADVPVTAAAGCPAAADARHPMAVGSPDGVAGSPGASLAGAVAGGTHRDGHTNNRGSGRTDDSRSTSPSTRQSRT